MDLLKSRAESGVTSCGLGARLLPSLSCLARGTVFPPTPLIFALKSDIRDNPSLDKYQMSGNIS